MIQFCKIGFKGWEKNILISRYYKVREKFLFCDNNILNKFHYLTGVKENI